MNKVNITRSDSYEEYTKNFAMWEIGKLVL